jgi:penicillin-binding protein 1A
MVGGSDFDQVKFNLATQAHRQAGSSFKPFSYAEAVHEGISPETMYISKHLSIDMGKNARPYEVDNYDFIHRGPITLLKAMADSDNTVFVQLALDLGLQKVVEMANKLGVDSEIDAYPATAIGGLRIGVTPLEMASAYSTFANGGTHMEPFLVQKVTEDKDGEEVLLEEHRSVGEEVLSNDEAAVVTEALQAVVTRGTASYYHDLDAEIGRPAAGKTGTSNEFIDAWFIGFIPQLSTSVWVGYPNERRSMVNINGLEVVNGENYPLDIWSLYMQGAVQKYPTVEQFDTPSPDLNLEVKTDGRTYVKPPPPPEKTTEEKTKDEKSTEEKSTEDKPGDEKKKEPGQGDAAAKPDIKRPPGVRQTPSGARRDRQPARPTPARQTPARQTSATPSPSSASPASASPAADGG